MISKQPLFKQQACILLSGITLLFLSSCAAPPQIDTARIEIIDVTADLERMSALGPPSGSQELEQPVILKIPAGHELPVSVTIDTPLFAMASDCSRLSFRRDLFIYLDDEQMLASPDSERWALFNDLEAVKELFDGKHGEISLGIRATKEQGVMIEAGVSLQPK